MNNCSEFVEDLLERLYGNNTHSEADALCIEAATAIRSLQDQNERLRKDAARYRWLRMNRLWLKESGPYAHAGQLDAAIDANISPKEPTP